MSIRMNPGDEDEIDAGYGLDQDDTDAVEDQEDIDTLQGPLHEQSITCLEFRTPHFAGVVGKYDQASCTTEHPVWHGAGQACKG